MTNEERLEAYRSAVRDFVFARDRLGRAEYEGDDTKIRVAAENESAAVMRLIDLGDRS